jgi:UDP-N-acetylmuramoyl-L-alanyl-D-glutamate--2,6-diaminopimelate ligase
VVNVDDVHGRLLLDAAEIPMTTFSLGDVHDVEIGPTHHSYTWRGRRVRVGIGGRFNVRNSLAAATVAEVLDVPLDAIVEGLAGAGPVPGRFEPVDAGQGFAVLVDYAHTPDGLEEVLSTAREVAGGGRVIVVFGCGGDRDREKRPAMGEVAARLADVVVVTSDNPRSEDPGAIIAEVLAGVPAERAGRLAPVTADRRDAIGLALRAARPGDVVVIAGKGHETTQTIGDAVVPFDDRQVARTLLEALA